MTVSIPALTIWQPWASLILIGAKPYEFRGWRPPRSLIGKRMAIHAGARPVKLGEVRDLIERLDSSFEQPCLHVDRARDFLERVETGLRLAKAGDKGAFRLPRSCVIGTAIVGEPKLGDECAAEFGIAAGNDSDRQGTFNWGWPMLSIEPLLPPIEMSGKQGLWRARI